MEREKIKISRDRLWQMEIFNFLACTWIDYNVATRTSYIGWRLLSLMLWMKEWKKDLHFCRDCFHLKVNIIIFFAIWNVDWIDVVFSIIFIVAVDFVIVGLHACWRWSEKKTESKAQSDELSSHLHVFVVLLPFLCGKLPAIWQTSNLLLLLWSPLTWAEIGCNRNGMELNGIDWLQFWPFNRWRAKARLFKYLNWQ